jgi:hypothetical protein
MNAPCALGNPASGHFAWVIGKDRDVREIALSEPDTLTVFKVDGWNKKKRHRESLI